MNRRSLQCMAPMRSAQLAVSVRPSGSGGSQPPTGSPTADHCRLAATLHPAERRFGYLPAISGARGPHRLRLDLNYVDEIGDLVHTRSSPAVAITPTPRSSRDDSTRRLRLGRAADGSALPSPSTT